MVAANGIRLAPPTRKTPAIALSGSPEARMTPLTIPGARASSGAVKVSSSSRVKWTSRSRTGTYRSAVELRDRRSLAALTSS
jgi:hypothetical protein